MVYLINVLIIAACIVGLWGGAVWVVESASRIAKRLGMSELVIGLTVVAIATSAPEFAVTVSAALRGQSAISVGNVVGSNVFNLGIILGIVALFKTLTTNRKLLFRDSMLLLATGIMLLIFFYDLRLVFYEGVILSGTLVTYVTVLIIQKDKDAAEEVPTGKFKLMDIPILIAGVAIIITSAHFFVESATVLARLFGVSEWIIGMTIVAVGTSTPELATSLVAIYKDRHGISVGNLIGSDLFNLLGVLGVASILRPLNIQAAEYGSLMLLVASIPVFMLVVRSKWRITKLEALLLIGVSLLRWGYDFLQ